MTTLFDLSKLREEIKDIIEHKLTEAAERTEKSQQQYRKGS